MNLAKNSDLAQISFGDEIENFCMSRVGGRDLVVRTVLEGGWESFERPLPAVFLACAQRWPGLILDIGANTGFYSFLGLSASANNQVVAYEPDPHVREILNFNVFSNDITERLEIEAIALSHRTGLTTLFVPAQGHGLVETSSSLEANFKSEHSEEISVEVSRLDDRLDASRVVSLIKIDVEGHERSAVTGGMGVISRDRPIIAVELLGNADFTFFNDVKSDLNYRSVALTPSLAIEEERMIFHHDAWNHMMVPGEKWDEFSILLRKLGLSA